ncbi:hypothetical protein B0O80DRAFT_464963 [Mortierella sp. GBAus27b]|nr:hypothetical protein B0O80DRAFT_464963 [Mortierella sp. GBAus27b]
MLASILDDSVYKGTCQLERIAVDPSSLTDSGLDHLDSIVKKLPGFGLELMVTGMDLNSESETSQSLLSRYSQTLYGVLLVANASEDQWLPQMLSSFPTKDCFPNLSSILLGHHERSPLPPGCLSWIVAMISARSQEPESCPPTPSSQSSSAYVIGDHQSTLTGTTLSSDPLRPITSIEIVSTMLCPEEWKAVIDVIDFSTLKYLSFCDTNFSGKELDLLVDHVPDHPTGTVPLTTFDIIDTDMARTDPRTLEGMVATLRKKVPFVKIIT